MKFLIIVGTSRENNNTVGPAKATKNNLKRKDQQTELFNLKNKQIPPLGNRTYKENEKPVPQDIKQFSQKVKNSDGVIIVCPEYNHSIPGILKTALDHLYPEYEEKPFMYITVSEGNFGGVRALSHLHDITLGLGGHPGPDMSVSEVSENFSKDGEILNEKYDQRINSFIEKSIKFAQNS